MTYDKDLKESENFCILQQFVAKDGKERSLFNGLCAVVEAECRTNGAVFVI